MRAYFTLVHVHSFTCCNRNNLSTYLPFTITDQLNTYIQETMKCTPYELVYGQPPRNRVFPGNTPGHFMEEDVMDLINENNPSNKCKLAISMCINYLQVLTMQIAQLHAMNYLVCIVLTPWAEFND